MNTGGNVTNLVRHSAERAITAFNDAKVLANANGWNSCINRLYYACFYIVRALLIQRLDLRTKTHSGVKSLFHNHIVKQGLITEDLGRFYSSLMEKRGIADYDDDFEIFTANDILPLIPQTEAFINTIKQLIEIKQDS